MSNDDYLLHMQAVYRQNSIKKARRLNNKKLITFVRRNPGMTATGIAHCLHRKWGTVSSMLYVLWVKNLIDRKLSNGMRSDKLNAYRYYPI